MASTLTLSGFADEIANDLETQLDVLDDLGIEYLDLRSVGGTNVLDLSDSELRSVRETLDERGFGVSSIGSPIGKVDITDPFDPHRERFEHALNVAAFFDTPYIRLFSYYIPDGDEPWEHRGEVMRRMSIKAELAADAGITLLHENEKDIYGDTPARCRDLIETVDSPHLKAIFDPANFLELDVEPYPDALLDLVEHVEYLHIKDAELGERGAIKPAGEGDGSIPETLAAFRRRDFDGFASLEPHLAKAGAKGGYSGPEAFRTATEALRDALEEADANHR